VAHHHQTPHSEILEAVLSEIAPAEVYERIVWRRGVLSKNKCSADYFKNGLLLPQLFHREIDCRAVIFNNSALRCFGYRVFRNGTPDLYREKKSLTGYPENRKCAAYEKLSSEVVKVRVWMAGTSLRAPLLALGSRVTPRTWISHYLPLTHPLNLLEVDEGTEEPKWTHKRERSN
jgi:hypothetical protein